MYILSILVGILVSFIDVIFGYALIFITEFRDEHFLSLIGFLPIFGLILMYVLQNVKDVKKGMGLLFEKEQNKRDNIPILLIPIVLIGTLLTHLFGGSVGREGVAVQIGASIATNFENFAKKFEKLKIYSKMKTKINNRNRNSILVCMGISAGFSGLFQAPIASIFFAIEVMFVGKLNFNALPFCFLSSYSAYFMSRFLHLEKFHLDIVYTNLSFIQMIEMIIFSALVGLLSIIFSKGIKYFKGYFSQIFQNEYIKILTMSVVLVIFITIFHFGRYSGLGTNLIYLSFNNPNKIYIYDFILKLIFTVFTISIGFLGGEVTPLFAIGASFGVFFAQIFHLPITLFAAIGYCTMFGASTNTLLAPIFIGLETFSPQILLYIAPCCIIAKYFNFDNSIYSLQRSIK